MAATLRRVDNAVLCRLSEDLYAETDGECIWVNRDTPAEFLTHLLVHEALHDLAKLRVTTRAGELRTLSCDVEHRVMRALGCRLGV